MAFNYVCPICNRFVKAASISCLRCHAWVHFKCYNLKPLNFPNKGSNLCVYGACQIDLQYLAEMENE